MAIHDAKYPQNLHSNIRFNKSGILQKGRTGVPVSIPFPIK